jgi:hypothetical protein
MADGRRHRAGARILQPILAPVHRGDGGQPPVRAARAGPRLRPAAAGAARGPSPPRAVDGGARAGVHPQPAIPPASAGDQGF